MGTQFTPGTPEQVKLRQDIATLFPPEEQQKINILVNDLVGYFNAVAQALINANVKDFERLTVADANLAYRVNQLEEKANENAEKEDDLK